MMKKEWKSNHPVRVRFDGNLKIEQGFNDFE